MSEQDARRSELSPGGVIRPDLPRVFCVGMNKTGTSSMKACFRKTGFTPVGSPATISGAKRLFKKIVEDGDYETSLRLVPNFVAFEDRPWNVWDMYRRLHQAYPDGKFILTVRDPKSWWTSVNRWLTEKKPHMRSVYKRHLRARRFREREFIAAYERYNAEVISYFSGHSGFITMDVVGGDGWGKVCSLLEVAVPDQPFPHKNEQGPKAPSE